jgi:hypothetical protein
MMMPQLPGSSTATITEENGEETTKGENSVNFFSYFMMLDYLMTLYSAE